ncbi:MAG: ABC transporter ATP-binding protein [Atopobiaceae bacterium]|nr:ABC transporter ATP-binding protein [Atopobiaceae bacterium]
MSVIECNDVSIRYITGDFKSIGLKEYVVRKLTRNFHVQEFWADRHVTFSVERGDMLGIIGSNGAGKSTLLKAVTGIMIPTDGTIKTHGKIAALLELASGFDAQMTVRENTYLRGAMLGYTKQFLDERYDEIIAFAELEEFQDYMFKQLSSGMKSRLAFSVACLVDPDILILDEVLSVGDGAFRKKSGDKMMEILSGGTTGVLVSHSIGQVRELCNKILWLDHGNQIAFSDNVQLYCDAYEEFLSTKKLPQSESDVYKLAEDFSKRSERARAERQRKEAKRLEKVLEKGTSESAVLAAIKILQKSRPEALAPEYNGGGTGTA